MNLDHELLIDHELISSKKNIREKVHDIGKRHYFRYKKKHIYFFIDWDKSCQQRDMKIMLENLLLGVRNYYNEISLNRFQKQLSECSREEKRVLLKEFVTFIKFYINNEPRLLTPPPPPIESKAN